MKFTVTMKDPDALHDSVYSNVSEEVGALELTDLDEIKELTDQRYNKAMEVVNRWFRFGEYLSVEIDTEAGTCVVLPHGNFGK